MVNSEERSVGCKLEDCAVGFVGWSSWVGFPEESWVNQLAERPGRVDGGAGITHGSQTVVSVDSNT